MSGCPRPASGHDALAETVNGLYKTEVLKPGGRWRSVKDVELATSTWLAWWNTSGLHSALGCTPPAECGAAYY